jgi:hypothetical protein
MENSADTLFAFLILVLIAVIIVSTLYQLIWVRIKLPPYVHRTAFAGFLAGLVLVFIEYAVWHHMSTDDRIMFILFCLAGPPLFVYIVYISRLEGTLKKEAVNRNLNIDRRMDKRAASAVFREQMDGDRCLTYDKLRRLCESDIPAVPVHREGRTYSFSALVVCADELDEELEAVNPFPIIASGAITVMGTLEEGGLKSTVSFITQKDGKVFADGLEGV